MNKCIVLFFGLCVSLCAYAQEQDAKQLHQTARSFMQQGDHSNAVLVLKRAIQLEPKNIEIIKDLSLNYYFNREFDKALEVIKPVIDNDEADDQCYQIAGDIYFTLDQPKDAEKVYKKGLKKFPENGLLYNALGEILWAQKDASAIKQWEKGIEIDPSFSKNYYNATKYYFFIKDKIWPILYGEIFVNMEPLSTKSAEIKNMLLESYKKLFTDTDVQNSKKAKNAFEEAFISCMNKQNTIAYQGINAETLTMIRTRFILDWFANYAEKYPFKLFVLQRQLLQEGMFDAYNQWIFGAAQNLAAYQNWINTHTIEYNELNRFQKGRVFKISKGEYYQQKK
jgi:tetratricopeptide (TPR) repeat protein